MCTTSIKRRTKGIYYKNCDDADINNKPILDYTCGRLVGFEREGAQVVEVIKPLYKPYGFYIAKGRMRNSKVSGVFITRMRDYQTLISLARILDPGDEILEIDGVSVKEKNIMEINKLIVKKNKIFLKTLLVPIGKIKENIYNNS
ncbi:uncharacterized protein C09G1.4-like [Tachypleus tridentatus]|uniref:uncharacterized protein C09G1.4-like n=1 Tax=Tachypleus tridentatus TaxID=6853 RepID=UPI003FD05E59